MNFKLDFFKRNKIPKRAEKIIKQNDRDKQGNLIIKQGTYVISKMSVQNYSFSDGWIFLSQPGVINRQKFAGQMALVKSYIADKCPKHYTGIDAEMTTANNFILPEIAKQFGLKVAEYYNVVFEDSEELQSKENYIKIEQYERQKILPNKRYLLTPSFIKEDEELIHLADVLENSAELRVSKMLSDIEKYLKIRHVPEVDIEQVKKEFIKQSIFNRFIDFSDEHNLNSGIIVSRDTDKIRARLTPCYDLDFAAGVYNMTGGEFQPRAFFRKSDDGKFDLIPMLNQFKGEFEKEYLKEIIPQINIQDAIEKAQKYGNFKLSERAKNKYEKFFRIQIKEITDFYNKVYGEKDKQGDFEGR